jgi:hypothetical protein
MPEATLSLPESVEVGRGGFKADSARHTTFWVRRATPATPDDVRAFFERELAARGWLAGGGSAVIGSQFEAIVCAWHRGNDTLRVAVFNDSYRDSQLGGSSAVTEYELALIAVNTDIEARGCNDYRH